MLEKIKIWDLTFFCNWDFPTRLLYCSSSLYPPSFPFLWIDFFWWCRNLTFVSLVYNGKLPYEMLHLWENTSLTTGHLIFKLSMSLALPLFLSTPTFSLLSSHFCVWSALNRCFPGYHSANLIPNTWLISYPHSFYDRIWNSISVCSLGGICAYSYLFSFTMVRTLSVRSTFLSLTKHC